ncbi:MAG TPA: glycoside hydrolase family 97 catalytic domain-containing protein [Saprospiraceae bacterium]|nr:glycoside hydrolase family 97 catalytic domain-containing protein [Saprospiraceae bacterium]
MSNVFKNARQYIQVFIVLMVFVGGNATFLQSQTVRLESPNKKVVVSLKNKQNQKLDAWYLEVSNKLDGKEEKSITKINLGLSRSDQEFASNLRLLKFDPAKKIIEQYDVPFGKKSKCTNEANEIIAQFENDQKTKLNLHIRAYNDGVTFRYEFPQAGSSLIMNEEYTSYEIPNVTKRWMEPWNPANEGTYSTIVPGKLESGEWGYPALFHTQDTTCWFLIHEADLDRNYCGTKLSNVADSMKYKLTFHNPKDARGFGESKPTIQLPWKSPWRVIIIGGLPDIVASTLVDDVSTPSKIKNTEWIKPGLVSWNYWSSNHGTKDFQIVKKFADLAAEMNWSYTLLDWEWDGMSNGGNVEDAAKYIQSIGVKPLIWYNSGGDHTTVTSTPKDRMLTHENRLVEFAKLRKMGFVGVKVDFFESEKQHMIQYYLDILEDAAAFEMMVYFHGCLVPRGWARTYPNLMTYEGVRGAEWYNNVPTFTAIAPEHNTILPFTRNVIGSMDYTPVTFTNSQFAHITSFGHELALGVVFESGLQHLADRPEGYRQLPFAAKLFLSELPNAWDETKLLDGYPGREVLMARRKGNEWYLGSICNTRWGQRKALKFDFLPPNTKYKLTLIKDGSYDQELEVEYAIVDSSSNMTVNSLRRGGFAAKLSPIN